MKHTTLILIAHKDSKVHHPNACHIGLGVTANNTANFLNKYNIPAIAVSVIDGYDLRDGLIDNRWGNVTHVVMCAPFFDTQFLHNLCLKFPDIRFTITYHSNAGFLGVDQWAMGVIGEQITEQSLCSNFNVSVNSKKFANVLNKIYDTQPINVLPNLYTLNSNTIYPVKKKWTNRKILKIGTFCAIRSLKNIPTAAFAAAILCKKYGITVEFCIMKGREEDILAEKIVNGIERLFSHIPNLRLVQYGWREWNAFRDEVVSEMDILIQTSFTESFNIVTADGIYCGIPSVVGEAIDWIPNYWKANVDDAADVARVAEKLMFTDSTSDDGYAKLVDHNNEALELWKAWITPPHPEKKNCYIKKFFGKLKNIFS